MTITKRTLTTPRPETGRKVAYLVRVEVPRDPESGKRRWRSEQVATRAEAEALHKEWSAEASRGTALVPSKATVSDLLDAYLTIEVPKTVAEPNRELYRLVIEKHLKPSIGDVLAQKLTVQQVEQVLAGMQSAGKSSSLITKTRMRLIGALRMGQRWNILTTNVAEAVKPPKIEYAETPIWSANELRSFLDTAREHWQWPLWLLFAETGARISELLGLGWEDFDLDRDTMRLGRHTLRMVKHVPTIKAGGKSKAAGRTIRLTPGTVSELREYRKVWVSQRLAEGPGWNPENVLFPSKAGTLPSPNNVRRTFDQLVSQAGVTPITPHSIRKTAITLAIANGASPKAVARRVGHADARLTLDVYSRVTASMDDELLSVVEATMNGNTSSG